MTNVWFICVLVRMSQCVRVRVGPAGKWHGNKLPRRATEEEGERTCGSHLPYEPGGYE